MAGKQRIIERLAKQLQPIDAILPFRSQLGVLGWFVSYETKRVDTMYGPLICRRIIASWHGSKVTEDSFDSLERLLSAMHFPDTDGGDDLRGDEDGEQPARRFIDWRAMDGGPVPDAMREAGESVLAVQMGLEEAAEVARRNEQKEAHQATVKGMGKWKSTSKKGKRS